MGSKIARALSLLHSRTPGFCFLRFPIFIFRVLRCCLKAISVCMERYRFGGEIVASDIGFGRSLAMAMTGVLVRLPDEMIAAIDARAGDGGRAKWIRGVLDAALSDGAASEAVEKIGMVGDAVREVARPPALVSGSLPQSSLKTGPFPSRPKVVAPVPVAGEPVFRRPDDRLLWLELRKKRGPARALRDRLGWMEMRVERAVSSLLSAGLVRLTEGLLEAEE